jgi:hypothetical protein
MIKAFMLMSTSEVTESESICTSSLMSVIPVKILIFGLRVDVSEMDLIELKPGMTFTIEPIFTLMDSSKILYLGSDKFSYVSLCNPSA